MSIDVEAIYGICKDERFQVNAIEDGDDAYEVIRINNSILQKEAFR